MLDNFKSICYDHFAYFNNACKMTQQKNGLEAKKCVLLACQQTTE